jgi:MFS transporter, putative metabolite:H+ symporter
LRDSALIGFPFTFGVAWMYGFWSSKKTLLLLTTLTATAMLGFAIAGDAVVQSRLLLYALLVMPIWGINTVTSVLCVYSAEIYPTRIRSRGSGLAAGASKAGGVMIIALVILGVATPSIAGTTLIGAIPMALAALGILLFGVETRKRRLEEITAGEFRPVSPAP